jgi:protein SCO1/2
MGVSSTLAPGKPDKPQSAKGFSWKNPAVLWVALAAIPVIAIVVFAVLQPVKVRPRIGLAPGYIFTDMHGATLTNEDLRGKLVFYNFIYTNCADPCPQPMDTMRDVQKLVKDMDTGGLPVEFVTISFDPQRDTPEQLRRYAEQLAAESGADLSNWHFVTGPPDRVKNVIGGGFRVFYEQNATGGFTFDPAMALVDGNGIMRAVYERQMPDMATVERDLNLLLAEVHNSEGPGKLVYEAAHLFLCYPPS